MKFWTIQSKEVMDIIDNEGIYYPDNHKSRYAVQSKEYKAFYDWLVNAYNEINKSNYKGLVYVFSEASANTIRKISSYNTFQEIIRRHKDIVWGIWKCFSKNYKVIELDFNENLNPLFIDINDFQVIMPPLLPMPEITYIKRALSQGKLIKTQYSCNLIQAHVPYINKKDITNVYPLFEI